MLPDRVSNPGPLTYESGVLPIALRGPARPYFKCYLKISNMDYSIFDYLAKSLYFSSHIVKTSHKTTSTVFTRL